MRFRSIQYLRGLAALLVVVAHTTEYPVGAGDSFPGWTARTGDIGVLTFFVISGFIITVVTGPGRFDLATFALRRLLRVVPLYWLCTGVLLAATLIAPSLFKTTTAGSAHALLSLFFIPHPAPGDGANYWSPLLKPGWTLNFEMFFYALTASLFWCSTGRLRAILLTAILAGLVVLSYGETRQLGVLDFYASTNLIAFMAGIWLAELVATSDMRPSRAVCAAAVVSAAGLFGLVYAMPTDEATRYPALLAAAAVVLAGLLVERAEMLPRMPWLGAVGDASYSLYLTHMFSIALAWKVLLRLAGPLTPSLHMVGVAASLGAAIVVALVSERLIERPFNRLAHRGRPRPAVANQPPPGPVPRVDAAGV